MFGYRRILWDMFRDSPILSVCVVAESYFSICLGTYPYFEYVGGDSSRYAFSGRLMHWETFGTNLPSCQTFSKIMRGPRWQSGNTLASHL